jgi:hypothetical protein
MDNNSNASSNILPSGIQDHCLIGDTLQEELICPICLSICFKPLMIECCQKLICSECIRLVIEKFKNCPLCKNGRLNFDSPSKFINRLFDHVSFECTWCSEIVNYALYHDHFFNLCTLKSKKFAYCKNCEHIYKIKKPHHCSEGMKKWHDMNKLERKLQKILFPQIYQAYRERKVKLTIHKHLLYFDFSNLIWDCNLCEEYFNQDYPSFRCGCCNFDICESCIGIILSKPKYNIKFNHKHSLDLAKYSNWICDNCQHKYTLSYSWNCKKCKYFVCYKCL